MRQFRSPCYRTTRAWLLLLGGVGLADARTDSDLTAWSGTWTLLEGAQLRGEVADAPNTAPIDGATIALRPVGDSNFEFSFGCDCVFNLVVTGSAASLGTSAECDFVFQGQDVAALVTEATITLEASGQADLRIAGGPATMQRPRGEVTVFDTFSLTGRLALSDTAPVDCGSEDQAVGVVPYRRGGVADCPLGAGHAGLGISMDAENDLLCEKEGGARGEPIWALPRATAYSPACTPRAADVPLALNDTLTFCRVDGRKFKPLATDPTDVGQFYAVLKLGTSCPAGSVEMVQYIDNEATDNQNWSVGKLGPNTVETGGGACRTTMHFCYFQVGSSPDQTMASFPDLGLEYAVFHDFEGPQPSWVTLKHWMYAKTQVTSDNALVPSADDPQAARTFGMIVERRTDAVRFDMAKVR